MKLRVITLGLALGTFLLYTSHSGGPQTGKTGAPGEGLCTQCHTTGNPFGLDGTVSISGLPATITGGSTHTIVVTVTNPNGLSQGAGFQMTALDESDLKFGTFSSPSSGSKVHSGGGRDYHDHTMRRTFSGGTATWTVMWTAPVTITDEEVTFYAAGNITDPNPGFNTSGDLIVTTNVSGTVQGSGAPLIATIISSQDVSCHDGMDGSATAQATGGAGGYQYDWSDGQTGPSAFNLAAGSYTVTVTDAGNNTATADVVISQPTMPTTISTLILNNVSCNGKSDGQIQVLATGNNGGFTYQWSHGPTGPLADKLEAGTYRVTATDIKNCASVEVYDITEPDAFESLIDLTHLGCGEDSTGYIKVSPQNGRQPFRFSWSDGFMDNGSSTERNNLAEGQYTIVITDFDGCSEVETITLDKEEGFELDIAGMMDILCGGENTGQIEISITDANPPVSVSWNTGDTSRLLQGLASGTYKVTVEDASNCVDSLTVTLTEPEVLSMDTIMFEQPLCPSDSGYLVYSYSGGQWNGLPVDTISLRLDIGQHVINAIDSNGCERHDTFNIVVQDTSGPRLVLAANTVVLDPSGTAQFSFDHFDAGSTDTCSIDSVLVSPDNFSCADIGQQIVVITAWDDSGNVSTESLSIEVMDTSSPVVACMSDTVAFDCDYSYQFPSATDNCSQPDYMVLSGPGPGVIFPVGLTMVSIAVSDASGNVTICDFTVEVINDLVLTTETLEEALCAGDSSRHRLIISGGVGQKTWILEGDTLNVSGDTFELVTAKAVSVEVWDTSGCFAAAQLGKDLLPLSVDSSAVQQLSGGGNDDGQIMLYVSGGEGSYQYEWYNSLDQLVGTDNPVTDLSPDKYYCVVSDDNDCEILSDTFEIKVISGSTDPLTSLISVFPNPAAEQIMVQAEGMFISRIEIIDLLGQRQPAPDISAGSVSLDGLADGIYYLLIDTDQGRCLKQLIVHR